MDEGLIAHGKRLVKVTKTHTALPCFFTPYPSIEVVAKIINSD